MKPVGWSNKLTASEAGLILQLQNKKQQQLCLVQVQKTALTMGTLSSGTQDPNLDPNLSSILDTILNPVWDPNLDPILGKIVYYILDNFQAF